MSSPVRRLTPGFSALLALAWATQGAAQLGAPPPPPPTDSKAAAPQDLTGYWVSLVTEDWRYRMLTPDKGDYSGISLNPAGRALADKWDPGQEKDSGCKAYGGAAIMRVPTRLHIEWQDDNLLRIDTDAGKQTRLLHFNSKPPAGGEPTTQGFSVASWEGLPAPGTGGVATTLGSRSKAPAQGYLKVLTTQLTPGYLRKNGVPYGAGTQVEEYFDSFKEPDGNTWLIVTTIVSDPEYLAQTYITSSQFKKLPGPTGWNPTDCAAR